VSPVEYADGKRSLRAYIAVYLQTHCNPSSYRLEEPILQSLWQTAKGYNSPNPNRLA